MKELDLNGTQLNTPENSMLSLSWLVEADTKFAPHKWKTDIVCPYGEASQKLGNGLDNCLVQLKTAIKAAYPNKTNEELQEFIKWNNLPYSWGPYLDKDGNKRQGFPDDNYLVIRTNKKTHKPNGTPNTAPVMFDNRQQEPLNDTQKKKYIKIGPCTTAQVALYVFPYHKDVGSGLAITPSAINIKKFIPFGSQAQTAEGWGFTVDAPQQESGTPATPNPKDNFGF